MQLRKNRLATSLALMAALPATGVAQEGGSDDVGRLPAVEVTGEAEGGYRSDTTSIGRMGVTELRDVPQTVTVINREVLDAQNANSLRDALRYVPGITMSAGEGGNIGDNINLRGYSARTDLFLDGFRDRGQYVRDTFALDAVEVLKGPSSMLFGRGSTGGVINQVSKVPGLDELRQIDLTVGTEDYYRLSADVNQPISDSAAFRVALMGQRNGSTRDVVKAEQWGIAPSISFGLKGPTKVTLSALVQRREEIPDYGFPFVDGRPLDADRDNFYGFTDDRYDQDVNVLSARIEHELSSSLRLRNQTQYNDVSVHAMPTTVTNAGLRNRRDREIDDSSLFNQTDLIAKFATGSVKHTLTAGFEIGRDEYENQGYDWGSSSASAEPGNEPPIDLYNPVYGPMPSDVARTRGSHTETKADTLAAYIGDTLELSEHWKLVAGLRWDRFEAEQKTVNAAGEVTTDTHRTDVMTSYRAGVIFQPTITQSYYVSYGTSFNPSAETVTLSETNQSVEPEKNRSYEIGAKWDLLDGGLALNAAVFRVEKTNARSTDPQTGTVSLDGETRVQGFELGITGNITAAWQVFGGYTYLDGEILDLTETSNNQPVARDGNTLPNTPEHTATLWTTYRFLDAWEAGGGVVYSSDRYVNNANSAKVDGYTRVDATLAYRQPAYDLRLNLLNVTDEEYFEVASGGRATPAQRRTAMLTLRYRM